MPRRRSIRPVFAPFAARIPIEELLVEMIASIATGVLMTILSIAFLSNEFFQLSLFTSLAWGGRNASTRARAERMLRDVQFIAVDARYRMARLNEMEGTKGPGPGDVDLRAIRDSLEMMSALARGKPGIRFVAGIDYLLLEELKGAEKAAFIDVLAGLPQNLVAIFGGSLERNPIKGVTMLGSEVIADLVREAARSRPSVRDQVHLASLSYIRSSVTTGFDAASEIKAAIGYLPLVSGGSGKYFFSLPLCMYALGELGLAGGGLYTEFSEGNARLADEDGFFNAIAARTGFAEAELVKPAFYNFFLPDGIAAFDGHFAPLSSLVGIREELEEAPDADPISEYWNWIATKAWQARPDDRDMTEHRGDGVRYYFIAPGIIHPQILEPGEENDEIITLAMRRMALSGDYAAIEGVNAHVVGLANLLGSSRLRWIAPWASLALGVALAAACAATALSLRRMIPALLSGIGYVALLVGIAYLAFRHFDTFIPLQKHVAVGVFGTVAIVLVRYARTGKGD